MLRSSQSRKGQWFIISAVIISGVFLSISILIKNYGLDASKSIMADDDFYFRNIIYQLNQTIKFSDVNNLENNVNEFIYFSQERLAEKGYLLNITILNLNEKKFNITLSSDKMKINSVVDY